MIQQNKSMESIEIEDVDDVKKDNDTNSEMELISDPVVYDDMIKAKDQMK